MRLTPCLAFAALVSPLFGTNPKGATVAFITNNEGAHLTMYLPGLAESEDTLSVVMADASGGVVADARRILGKKLIATYSSTEELFQHYHPPLAVITLEPKLATPAVDAALDAGCNVLVEKPAVLSVADFTRLAAKAEQKHRFLLLALGNRLSPPMRFARDFIRDGNIGKIYGIELHIIADQTRLSKPGYANSWFAQKARAGGGHLIWLGIHWMDLGMFLTDSSITEISGFTANVGGQPLDVEDSAVVSFKFDHGFLGDLTSAYYVDKSYHSHVKVWGSRGWIDVDPYGADKVCTYYSTLEAHPKVRTYDIPTVSTGYTALVEACVRAALGLEPPPLTTRDSLRVIKTIFAAYRAAETGQTQKISADGN